MGIAKKYVRVPSLHTPRDQSSYLTCTPDTESYNKRINKLQCIGRDGGWVDESWCDRARGTSQSVSWHADCCVRRDWWVKACCDGRLEIQARVVRRKLRVGGHLTAVRISVRIKFILQKGQHSCSCYCGSNNGLTPCSTKYIYRRFGITCCPPPFQHD